MKWMIGRALELLAVMALVGVMGLAGPAGCNRGADEPADAEAEDVPYDEQEAMRAVAAQQDRLGLAMEEGGSPTELVEGTRELVEQYPDYAPARRLLGYVLHMSGRVSEALDELERALDLEPGDAELHNSAGGMAMELGDFERAQRHYSQAASLEPENGRYRVHLGMTYVHRERYSDARRAFLEALQLDASLHRAHAGLSDLYARQGELRPAIDQIRRAIELVDPQERHADERRLTYVRRHATLLRRANEPEAALAVLQGLDPQQQFTDEISEDLARTWAMLGEPGQAARHYAAALVLDPSDDEAAARTIEWALRAGNHELAREHLEKLRAINPRHERVEELEQAVAEAGERGD